MILPASAFAQQVGVKAGINSASLTPEEDEDPDISRRLGPIGGVWVGTALTSRFSFQVEGLFSEKGVKFDSGELGFGGAEVRLRYLEIPVLARGDFGAAGSPTRVFVVGGAAPAFMLAARAKAEFEGEEQTRDIGDDIKPFDLGLVGGIGVEVGRALIEARYTHGLLHINEDDNGDEDRIKNRVFSVMAGFRFR
jgi:hypothetical protein